MPNLARILHFDYSTGASGDKTLGALLEACEALGLASLADLENLAQTLVPGVVIQRYHVIRGGIAATHLTVSESHAPHRSWMEIEKMIESAINQNLLSIQAGATAQQAFKSLAEAEALAHKTPIDQVHFHEIGAADSIVDILGSCLLFDRLAAQVVYATPLTLGFGSFQAAHGEMSIPAPATANLIIGLPVLAGPYAGEMTTPTGAALAKAFVTHWQPFGPIRVLAVGYGAGSREVTGASNTVRLLVGEAHTLAPNTSFTCENAVLIETNIDHRTPEAMAFITEQLLAAGALDVWQDPITMKKGRLAVRLSLLCNPELGDQFAQQVISQTGSLGLRMRLVERLVVDREVITIDTPWGAVRYKYGHYIGEDNPESSQAIWLRPEYDDVARLAQRYGLDYQTLYDDLCKLAGEFTRQA
ncbi:MAG: nickel pincer cofactor biosynthesis protein LarC [Coriobacteriales bacterium]|jgi:uncharacterized protein (TIGR00299 family) protein|nr:nickel pincer cofactor biosynthesis protein LarC [Coriobacteriales bacterium]